MGGGGVDGRLQLVKVCESCGFHLQCEMERDKILRYEVKGLKGISQLLNYIKQLSFKRLVY